MRFVAAEPPVSFVVRAEHLYVHVPFCARRCVYCDFSIAVRPAVPEEEYLTAIRGELRRHRSNTFLLRTLYFGGGTPSKLSATAFGRLMEMISGAASFAPDMEVTLEANPEDVTSTAAKGWRDAGITRVSLGIQSFNAEALTWMHRTHSAEQGRRAIEMLRDAGLTNISIDLIFALPLALERSWRSDLEAALAIEVPHVSVYGLTVEPHTPLGRWVARQTVHEAPEESFEQEFLAGSEMLRASGFLHYEVSNYARPAMHSRHNSAYWARKPYGGVGPSAHEFDGRSRRWNVSPYAEWVRLAERGEDPIAGSEVLGGEQVLAEHVYLGLRTSSGLEVSKVEADHLRVWVDSGWAEMIDPGRIRLTPLGWLRLDALAADLTHVRSRY